MQHQRNQQKQQQLPKKKASAESKFCQSSIAKISQWMFNQILIESFFVPLFESDVKLVTLSNEIFALRHT